MRKNLWTGVTAENWAAGGSLNTSFFTAHLHIRLSSAYLYQEDPQRAGKEWKGHLTQAPPCLSSQVCGALQDPCAC